MTAGLLAPFLDACARFPDRRAIVGRDGVAVSYAELRDGAAALAGDWRARGLGPGQRVLVAHPVSIPLYRALIAVWMSGCSAIFPEPFAGIAGLRHARRLLEPQWAVSNRVGRLLLPLLAGGGMRMLSPSGRGAPVEPAPPAEPALYSFTSGSTGAAKCIPRSHALMLAQSAAVSRVLASDRPEVDLVWFPVFVLACLANGGTAVLPDSALKRPDRPDTRALARQAAAEGVTRLLAPPAVAMALAGHGDMPRLSKLFTGGGPVLPQHFAALGRIADEVVAIYGSTEAEPVAVLSSRDLAPEDLDAMRAGAGLLAGRVVEGLDLRIEADEIQVAGPHVVPAYLDPRHDAGNKIAEAGCIWHRTGDGGRLDEQGRLWLRGRLAGRVGGLWPLEVEVAALSHPGIRAAALARQGDRPVLAVVRAPGAALPEGIGGVARVVELDALPMDRRHASKLDYTRLEALIARRAGRRG